MRQQCLKTGPSLGRCSREGRARLAFGIARPQRDQLCKCCATGCNLCGSSRPVTKQRASDLTRARQIICQASNAERSAPGPNAEVLTVKVGDRKITIETGEIGRQANGAVLVRDGETALYTTACCSGDNVEGSFLPFGVHYTERYSAAGKTSGSFFRREGRPKQLEMITARLTDRPLRPMFPKNWFADTQVLSWLLSFDGQAQPEPLSITAAGAALALSDIPLGKAVAGVRVALVDGDYIINPTIEEQSASRLDLIIAGTANAVLMIEGFCDFLTDQEMLKALEAGSQAISKLCEEIQSWANKIGKAKREDRAEIDTTWDLKVSESQFEENLRQLYKENLGKQERSEAGGKLRTSIIEELTAGLPEEEQTSQAKDIAAACKRLEAKVMRQLAVDLGVRADGRGLSEVRPISSSCGLLPRTHGSTLFTRGETQALAVTTLGAMSNSIMQDNLATSEDDKYQRFYLQYTFPPSSTGETGRVGFLGRREAGHGVLAERALAPIIPSEEEFPYSIRVESMITESNGSSSMASVCGGCLSMQDAGVPVKKLVAGVAMGLILNEDGTYRILTDILGSEDALGDMDFKVAGDEDGITAFQMDIKVEGISLDIMREALQQAKLGRRKILEEMKKCSPPPRQSLGPYTPHIIRVKIDHSMIGMVIGAGGRTIRALQETPGVNNIQVLQDQDGVFEIEADSREVAENCKKEILALIEEPEVGKTYYNCKVAGAERFGLFLEFLPGKQGLLHVSELAEGEELTDFDLDDRLDVTLAKIEGNKYRLSRKSRGRQKLEPGTVIREAKILEVKPYGVFVELPGGKSSLVHVSELYCDGEVRKAFSPGDEIDVMAMEPNQVGKLAGKQNFSRRRVKEMGANGVSAPAA